MAIIRESSSEGLGHDRAVDDRRRHRQLVERSIKENISNILSEESILGESENKKYKVPIKGIKEYSFTFGKNLKGVASGTGEEVRGQKLQSGDKSDDGKAGNNEGDEIYETEITLEEILEYIIDELELPYIQKKRYSEIIQNGKFKRKGYKNTGIKPRLAKKKSVIAKISRKQGIKRCLLEKCEHIVEKRVIFRNEDLKYYRVKPKINKESNAVIIFIMDVSASMDNTKKYLARSFFFIISCFIKKKYNDVQTVFISHTTTAFEVGEYDFFHRTESGGTYMSSGLKKAKEIITNRYVPELWNAYVMYASDGDNWGEDNEKTIQAITELNSLCNLVGYVEMLPSVYGGSMYGKISKNVKQSNFVSAVVKDKNELWNALKLILRKELKGDT